MPPGYVQPGQLGQQLRGVCATHSMAVRADHAVQVWGVCVGGGGGGGRMAIKLLTSFDGGNIHQVS